jgi:acyl-CoA synthetase (AMP-forming)/AMP-acid ligase II
MNKFPISRHTRIHQLFDERVAQAPDHPFLFMPDGVRTLGQLAEQVSALEAELREAGIHMGDRVLVAAENCPEHVALVLACSRVGAWACGVNARMTASELAGFAAKADARVLYFTVGITTRARAFCLRCAARWPSPKPLRKPATSPSVWRPSSSPRAPLASPRA